MDHDEFIDKSLDNYDSQMEDLFDSVKSLTELEAHHHQVKSEILECLPQAWRKVSGNLTVPDAIKKKLGQKIDSLFQKLKRHFEKSQKKEQAKFLILSVGKDAMNFYNDEMDKYFQNHSNASPKEIEMHHVKVSMQAVSQAKSNAGGNLNAELLSTLKEEMEHRRQFYHEKAVIISKASKDPAIGIDLGTTMCCIMVYYRGKCEIVPNRSQGNSHTTPSYVAFPENSKSETFGYLAKDEAWKNPENTIYDAKRMIGRSFNDSKLQEDITKWPFEVVDDNGNVKIKTWGKLRYPHEISARLLARFRMMADDHLKLPRGTIKKAVITVPAYFTEPQRRATYDAATCAGLKVLNILSEPTAAAIAYSWERRETKVRTALVYDLGGGTFDVAIAKVNSNKVDILCVDGDTHLGGQDFDQLLMDYCLKAFLKKEGIDIAVGRNNNDKTVKSESRSALARIKSQCEKAKKKFNNCGQNLSGHSGY